MSIVSQTIQENISEFDYQPIVVFTAANCVQCNLTTNAFTNARVKFHSVSLLDYPQLTDMMREEGLTQAPVVYWNGEVWYGFNPEMVLRAIDWSLSGGNK